MKSIKFCNILKNSHLRVVIFSLSILGMVFQGCARLELDQLEFNAPPGAYEDLEQLEGGVIGVYNNMWSAARMTTFVAPAWAGDDITTHEELNKADFREFDQRNVNAQNSRNTDNWTSIYQVIASINTVIERASGLSALGFDQAIIDRSIGEVLFIRGIMYHQLTRIFGEVPLLLNAVIVDEDIVLPSQAAVYQQIEADLLEAESKLPSIYPGVLAGAPRPNKGSARAVLARLYMDWAGFPLKDNSKYAQAAQSAKQVIDNKATHGFGLMNDLEDLWKLDFRFNQESVFTNAFCQPCGSLDNRKFGRVGLPAVQNGWQETFGEIRFFEDFPDGPRKDATYRMDLDWKTFPDQKNPILKKVTGPPGEILNTNFETSRNDFWMRYAEVLLIYAEASSRSGNITPASWEALNMIRRRAEGLPFASPNAGVDVTSGDLAELAFTERKWEFAGEYQRWYDLVRTERVEEALTYSRGANPSGILEHNAIIGSLSNTNYFSPLPQIATETYPNLQK